jgi:hypothetical protein
MKNNKPFEMPISNAELAAMVKDMDEIHNDQTNRAMQDSAAEWNELNHDVLRNQEGLKGLRSNRRTFLIGAGSVAAGGVLLAACSSSPKPSSSSTTAKPSTSSTSGALTGDLLVAGLAASLENLAVSTYGSGIKAAQAGKLGAVPPAIVTFAQTAMSQHNAHAKAWNSILTGAGKSAVTESTPGLVSQISTALGKVTTVTDLAKLALMLEDAAAATYFGAIGQLSNSGAIATAASIQPVEMQHAAILNFVLGTYPVPNSFATATGAVPTSDFTS